MTLSDISACRLLNQQIAKTKFNKPHEIVSWLIAMQAQEFAHAKWAIGLRLPVNKAGSPTLIDADIEKAFNDGAILRTHLMRPTWHFVTPTDIRWMLALTAPRVNTVNAFMYRTLELDTPGFKKSNKILEKTLEGGKHLTRNQLKPAFENKKIVASGFRLAYLLMRAELDGIICSGPRQGKQFTYALLEERVPPAKKLNYKEALAKLALQYFTSRGPATFRDFAWWSGLTIKDCKQGIAMLPSHFIHEMIAGEEYVFVPGESKKMSSSGQTTFIMPDYDEYGISYKNRNALRSENYQPGTVSPYSHYLVIDGLIEGTWQPIIKNKRITVNISPFTSLTKKQSGKVKKAVKRYTEFVNNES